MLYSITHENVKKTKVFLTFARGIEMEHWAKMGYHESRETF